MGLSKRGDVWWIDYRVGGQRVRESSGSHLKADAEKLLRERKKHPPSVSSKRTLRPSASPSGLPGESVNPGPSVGELRDLWLLEAFQKRSLKDDEQRFAVIVEHFGVDRVVGTITGDDINAWKKKLLKTPTGRKGNLAPATVNRYLTLLRAAINLAIKQDKLTVNPFKSVTLLQENNRRDKVCSRAEYDLLIARSSGELQLAIVFGYWTAMRLGEILGLSWDHVDLQQRCIYLDGRRVKNGEGRIIPIHDELLSALKQWKREVPSGNLFKFKVPTISRRFGSLVKAAAVTQPGIRTLVFHGLRHTALTNMKRAGADILTLKAIGGHKTMAMLQRYVHVDYKDVKEIFARM